VSFELYLQCFHKGEPASVPRQSVRQLFGEYLTEIERDLWRWGFDAVNSCDVYLTSNKRDPSRIQGLMVSRPIQDARLFDALLAILKLGNVVLYFPGGRAPLVADRKMVEHMPLAMVEALGKPKRVTTGKQISDAIEDA
jgi:hypothetical protein